MKPVVVKNVKIVERNFKSKLDQLNKPENKALKNALSYIAFLKNGVDGKKLLPTRSKYRVDFDLENATSGFANGIRKCILDEIPIYSMFMEEDKFDTNDRYILSDFLQKNIELVPILQELDPEKTKKWKISVNVLNSTDEVINVKSGDIEIYEGQKKIPVENLMSPNISIIELHPAMYLKISEIKIVQGLARTDAGKFAPVSNTRYEIKDMKPMAHSIEEKDSGTSSILQDPTKFHIGYTTYRNVKDPKTIIHRTCDTLTERLMGFQKELGMVKQDEKTKVISHFSTKLDVETRGVFYFFHFKEEAWTLINMISQYGYHLDEDVPFIAPSIIHPSTETGVIKIRHMQPLKIISDAVALSLKNIEILRKSF